MKIVKRLKPETPDNTIQEPGQRHEQTHQTPRIRWSKAPDRIIQSPGQNHPKPRTESSEAPDRIIRTSGQQTEPNH